MRECDLELNGANPFDYLTELQKHAEEVAKNPVQWMPWNYCQAENSGKTGLSKTTFRRVFWSFTPKLFRAGHQ
jgi:hypothetical protein